ncbi:hypothetical protein LTSEBAI_0815 [Salmonella enterica subsp. enterica serovar Baildon str. R6-199]|nr:hypothetical protein LTSEBAI_0815 [Salmonella enterica subsp. enterica serovar Baildon str. R6-199]
MLGTLGGIGPGYCGSICGGRRYMAMRARNPWIAALFCCCS